MWINIIVSSIMLMQILGRGGQEEVIISYSQYKDLLMQRLIGSAVIIENEFHGTLTKKVPIVISGRSIEVEKFLVNLRFVDSDILKEWDEAGIKYDFKERNTKWTNFLVNVLPFAFLVLRMLARKFTNGAITGGKGLEYFRMDDRLIYVLIAGWAAFLMVDKTRFHTLNMAALNTALIFSFLYIVQAMGIIKFFAMKKNIPVWVIPLGALMLISLFAQLLLFFAVMLASLGAIDFWADFRKLETPGGANGPEE
jgi:hypothetical protein